MDSLANLGLACLGMSGPSTTLDYLEIMVIEINFQHDTTIILCHNAKFKPSVADSIRCLVLYELPF